MPLINHTRENVYERRSKNCHVPGEGVKDVVESVGYNKFDNSSMHYIDRQRKIGWLPVEIGIGKNLPLFCRSHVFPPYDNRVYNFYNIFEFI